MAEERSAGQWSRRWRWIESRRRRWEWRRSRGKKWLTPFDHDVQVRVAELLE